jgi:hypothetical protein
MHEDGIFQLYRELSRGHVCDTQASWHGQRREREVPVREVYVPVLQRTWRDSWRVLRELQDIDDDKCQIKAVPLRQVASTIQRAW